MLSEKKSKEIKEKITCTGRSYRNLDFDTLSDELKLFDWNNFAENENDCWNIMSDRINTVIDTLCPNTVLNKGRLTRASRSISLSKVS